MTPFSFSKAVENPTIVVANFGGGLNSTAMLVAAAHGLISPMPDVALYAELEAEGEEVAAHVRWMMSGNVLPFPLLKVVAGDLGRRTLDAAAGVARNVVPFFTAGDRQKVGQLNRGCTRDFKIRPLERELRRLIGVSPRGRIPSTVRVEQWIGIGAEEIIRATPSRHRWVVNRWPLIELGWRREQCAEYLRGLEYPVPPKSRCVFCPYTSDARWADLKAVDSPEWRSAVEYDRAIRGGFPGSTRDAFVHRSLQPLDQATFDRNGGADLFNHECAGRCGT